MDRRRFLTGALGCAAGAISTAALGCGVLRRSGPHPPEMNLLLVVLEDCTAGSLACYGNPVVRTPHLDRFAASAVRFDRAYCQATVCNPARVSFLSGLRPGETGVYYNGDLMDSWLPPGTITLPELAKARGAYAVNVGKLFHEAAGASAQLGAFDRIELGEKPVGWRGISTGWTPPPGPPAPPLPFRFSADPELERRLVALEAQWERRRTTLPPGSREALAASAPFRSLLAEVMGDSGRAEAEELDGMRARLAAQLLEELAHEGRQFWLSIGFSRPHTPLTCPRRYVDLYDPEAMPAPAALAERDRGVPEVARRWGRHYDVFNQIEPTPERARRALAAYYACVSFVDAQLGIVLAALEATELAERTIVVILADHGFHLGEHGLWGKATLFEQSTRVPLLARVPGAAANGSRRDEIVELVDLLPTLCELWQLPVPRGAAGASLAGLLLERGRAAKRAAFSVCAVERVLGRSLRSRRYRYTAWRGHRHDGRSVAEVELYDLERDPWEQINLAGSPRHAAREAAFAHLLRQTGAWSPRFL